MYFDERMRKDFYEALEGYSKGQKDERLGKYKESMEHACEIVGGHTRTMFDRADTLDVPKMLILFEMLRFSLRGLYGMFLATGQPHDDWEEVLAETILMSLIDGKKLYDITEEEVEKLKKKATADC